MRALLPILTVLAVIVALWYAATVWMNAPWVRDQAARAGETVTFAQIVPQTLNQERPVLPAPHQVVAELWKGLFGQAVTSKRSLVYHAWVTLSATLLGFGIGTAMGILLAIGIVHNRAMDLSVMPWAIASQTIPILAIAPMIIVVLEFGGGAGRDPQGDHQRLSELLPGGRRHGEGVAQPGCDAAGPAAHLQRLVQPDAVEAALAGRRCPISSPA